MGDRWPDRRAAVERAVLAYLGRHPDAADSLAGICRWWLQEEGVYEEDVVVEGVLDGLARDGLLLRTPLCDGACLYRAARDRRDRRALAGHGG